MSTDKQIDLKSSMDRGSKVVTTSPVTVKITLGWKVVYESEVWIMPHHGGIDLILGTDFLIPAGGPLDHFNSTAKLPDELVVPLLKSAK